MVREERTFISEEVTETVVVGETERELNDEEISQLLEKIGVSDADIASLSEESKRNIVSQHKVREQQTEEQTLTKVDVQVGWQDENDLAKDIKRHVFEKCIGPDHGIKIRGGYADFEDVGFAPSVWFCVSPEQFSVIKDALSEYLKEISPELLS